MARLLELSNGQARVTLAPSMGGGVASFDALLPGGTVPVLRPWDGSDEPFALASNVLVPFSNRISGGGFSFDGVFHNVPCNMEGQDFPIHGDGFQRDWHVEQADSESAVLVLPKGQIGPFRYAARLDYRLDGRRLTSALTITNTGPRLPFGGGFHPWLPRTEDTRLAFVAKGVWLEDVRHMPTDHLELQDAPEWDYAQSRSLPDGLINNAFTGWNGQATVTQGDLGLEVEITASNLDVAIVYSPGVSADFFCFEPVNHPVDGVNLPGTPGMVPLNTGEALTLTMIIGWRELAST